MLQPEHDFVRRAQGGHQLRNALSLAELTDRAAGKIIIAAVFMQVFIEIHVPVDRIFLAVLSEPRLVFFHIPVPLLRLAVQIRHAENGFEQP